MGTGTGQTPNLPWLCLDGRSRSPFFARLVVKALQDVGEAATFLLQVPGREPLLAGALETEVLAQTLIEVRQVPGAVENGDLLAALGELFLEDLEGSLVAV